MWWAWLACAGPDDVADPDPTDDTDVPVYDGVVLRFGDLVEVPVTFTLPVPPSMDIALVMDASCAGTDRWWRGFDLPERDEALGLDDAHWGVAGFVDYPVSPYG
jgi:hypothetical protein